MSTPFEQRGGYWIQVALFVGDWRISLIISSSVTRRKESKAVGVHGGSVWGEQMKLVLEVREEWSLVILLVKKDVKASGRDGVDTIDRSAGGDLR